MGRITVLVLALTIGTLGCSKANPTVSAVPKPKTEIAARMIEKAPKPSPYKYKVVAERPRPVTTTARESAPKLPADVETAQSQ
jgi:hypothetical protein